MASKSFSVFTSFKAKDGMSGVFQNMKNKASGFGGQLNKLKTQSQQAGTTLKNSFDGVKSAITGVIALIATSVVTQTLGKWVDKASDLQETLGKTNETFKTDSQSVIEWSKTSIKSMGLAQQTALDTAALYGDMGAGMGMTTKRASEMAMSLTQLSADIASFKNTDQALSANALKGIFTGETEALKNLGVVMTETNLQEFAKKKGVGGKLKDMSQAQKIELRYQYVMEATKNSQGDFLRTGGNYANQARMFEENKKEMETRLGNIMLPKYNAVMKSLNATITKYSPTIEKGFGALFKNFEEGLRICSPLLVKFQELFKTFNSILMPIAQTSMPMFKTVLATVIVPALGLVIDSINNLFKAIKFVFDMGSAFYNFVKNNWLPLLLMLPIAIVGVASACKLVQTALDIWRLKMALLRMEGGLMSVLMNTKLVQSIGMFTSAIWKSVTALAAQTMAFLMSPVGLITLGIMALIGVVILLWKNWDKVTATVVSWWNSTKELLSGFWATCKDVFSKVGSFIKDNFINILLMALGPVGFIIKSLMNLPQIIKQIKAGGGIKIEGVDGGDVKNKSPKVNGNKNGSIEVKTTIDNRTGYNAETNTSLQSPSNLKLKPA